MSAQLSVYQYRDTPFVTITKGPPPNALPEYADGWKLREQINPGDIGLVALTPSKALAAMEREGAVTLDKFEVARGWREKWAPAYDPEPLCSSEVRWLAFFCFRTAYSQIYHLATDQRIKHLAYDRSDSPRARNGYLRELRRNLR